MRDHPTTYRGESAGPERVEWEGRATIHRKENEDGVLSGLTALHRGTFAEMIAMIEAMPPGDRDDFIVEKAGDRQYEADEICQLAARDDFPGR